MSDEEEALQKVLQRIKTLIDALRTFQFRDERNQNQSIPKDDQLNQIFEHLQKKNAHFVPSNENKNDLEGETSSSIPYRETEILECVILPLFQSLLSTLKQIDLLPEPQITFKIGEKNSRRKKPLPPPGMLSIAQYTDIACLLEYSFYFSLLSYYHLYTLPLSIPVRIRKHLPKSLRGRMHPGVNQLCFLFENQMRGNATDDAKPTISDSEQDLIRLHRYLTYFADIITHSRFRPMLLPRHLSDLYILVFLHNHMYRSSASVSPNSKSAKQLFSLEPYFTPHIEGTLVAKSLQSLLYTTNNNNIQSTQSLPSRQNNPNLSQKIRVINQPQIWIRPKVTYWLNRLAAIDLPSILYVFVHAAHYLPGATVPTAALHLSRALLTRTQKKSDGKTGEKEYSSMLSKKIWKQLVYTILIHGESKDNFPKDHEQKETNNRENNIEMAGRLVMVSILPLLSSPESYIKDILSLPNDLPQHAQNQSQILEPSRIGIQRMKKLLLVLPPPPYRNKFCELLLKNGVLDMLMKFIARVWSKIDRVTEKTDAMDVVKTILEGFISDSSRMDHVTSDGEISIVKQSVVYLMKSILNSLEPFADNANSSLAHAILNEASGEKREGYLLMETMLSQFEIRCTIVAKLVESVCLSSKKNSDMVTNEDCLKSKTSNEDKSVLQKTLASQFFQLTLILSYSSIQMNEKGSVGNVRLDKCLTSVKARLVAMLLLPQLFERCGVAVLLDGSPKKDASGILIMLAWIIQSAAKRCSHNQRSYVEVESGNNDNIRRKESPDFSKSIIENNFDWDMGIGRSDDDSLIHGEFDDILENSRISELSVSSLNSTASICVGLLIAILELGEEERGDVEERMFKSFLPSLQILASQCQRSFFQSVINANMDWNQNENDKSSTAELAEMAAHACVLILSRKPPDNVKEAKMSCPIPSLKQKKESHEQDKSYASQIHQAKLDLQSNMPPIRARGAVCIMRLARSITNARDLSVGLLANKEDAIRRKIVIDLDSTKPKMTEDIKMEFKMQENLPSLIRKLLHVAIFALNDEESYVYTAAIQAVSAIGDVSPSFVLPDLAIALSQGKLRKNFEDFDTYDDENGNEEIEVKLIQNQRIKIAEAIVFAIRRRGKAIDLHYRGLVEELLRGCSSKNDVRTADLDASSSHENLSKIQLETDLYFRHGKRNYGDDEVEESSIDEKMARLKTGGPIFEIEEDDVVRSCCLLCLSELIENLSSSLLVQFCGRIVDLCINSLHLDCSRPIRRSASLLAGDLYRYLLQNHPDFADTSDENFNGSLPVAVEMVLCNEESLALTLQQCLSFYSINTRNKLLLDEPTIARCKEAVSARSTCEEIGLFAAARILADAKKKEDNSKVPRSIQTMLQNDDVFNLNSDMKTFRINDDLHFIA